ncbi:MAG: GNAT family N-acetyltransferase, partial [Henriciella sp.]|nr:GNAT family N-acetyltransferase [Henriciella sp.]
MTDISANEPKKAVIYCRVSSKSQSTQGSGLDSQEHRCRKYAAKRGYQVEAVFPDDVSGGGDFMRRPGMVALLKFLDDHPYDNYVVVFDDLKRYARDVEFHLKLKREMEMRGARRDCLNFRFEDTPESKFMETIMAATGELEREQNRRQGMQKTKARLEQGYWVDKAVQRKGVATEAARALLAWGEATFGVTQFIAGHFQDNPASGRVLEKLGCERVGEKQLYSLARG